jgi:DNA-binding NarL/FixJ family response regulator
MNRFIKSYDGKSPDKKIIFIVEDNEVYARTLQGFLQIHFPNIQEIKTFRIGERCLMELNSDPDIVIMDYFLNSKYPTANNGLEIIKLIKAQKPRTNIVVLSEQEDYNVALEAIKEYGCFYVQKNQDAFKKIEQFIREIF